MSLRHLSLCALLVASLTAHATVSVSGSSFSYSQSFDSLAASGSSNAWANDSTLNGWSLFFPSTAVSSYIAGTGTGTGGGFYSLGTTSERALGSLATNGNTAVGAQQVIAAAFTNTGSETYDSFTLRFDGEQWRNNGNALAQSLTVQYGFGTSFAAVTTWTSAGSGFTFTSPVTGTTATALDGNLAANRVAALGGSLTTTWAPGQTLWLRWNDVNDSGNDHVLAIDNVSFSVTSAVPEPTSLALLLGGLGLMGFVARRRLR